MQWFSFENMCVFVNSLSIFEAYEITNSRIDMMKGHSKSDTNEGIMKVEEVPGEDEVNLDFEMVARVPEAYHFEGLMDTYFFGLSFLIYAIHIWMPIGSLF